MLWRALKHVKSGFYIDVGANDPTLYSVTRAFYGAGWSGINIEPASAFYERLQKHRPRDMNLRVGAGRAAGALPFFDIPGSGLATFDATIAQKRRQDGWNVETIETPVLPLAQICEKHAPGEIHFLKIDVEGAEKDVLEGMDFNRWRPWILVIEATAPMSQLSVHHVWEHVLTAAQYDFAYFDGLNRYYVAQEHAHLKTAFSTPPNVFDGFVLNADQESRLRASEAEAQAAQFRKNAVNALTRAEEDGRAAVARLADAESRIRAADAAKIAAEAGRKNAERNLVLAAERASIVEQELAAVYASTSWRITLPVRALRAVLTNPSVGLRWARRVTLRAQGFLGAATVKSVRFVLGQPAIRRTGMRVLARFPRLDAKVRGLRTRVIRSELARRVAAQQSHYDHRTLPRAASRLLDELKRNIQKNRN